MNAYDFSINYFAGLLLLRGADPYSNPLYRYPFPFTYFWALMALPGEQAMPLMFIIWGIINLGLLIYAFRKDFWKWIFYFPVLHEFSAGQVELMFWTIERQIKPGWRGAVLGALLTMKPQSAIILLPWHLVDWLKHDRKTLAKWFVSTAVLWGLPLLWRPDWIQTWLMGRGADANLIYSASVSTGLFSILRPLQLPLDPPYRSDVLLIAGLIGLIGVIIFVVGQLQASKEIAKACAALVSPLGLLYTQMTLMGTAPAWLLVPVNLASVTVALLTGNFVACLAVPLAVIGWHIWKRRQDKKAEAKLQTA